MECQRQKVINAFLLARVEFGTLFLKVFSQNVKPEEVPEKISEILKNLSDRVNELCVLKDVCEKGS